MSNGRDAIVGYLRSQLLGPRFSEDELLVNKPLDNYITGILYPQQLDDLKNENDDEHRDIAAEGDDGAFS